MVLTEPDRGTVQLLSAVKSYDCPLIDNVLLAVTYVPNACMYDAVADVNAYEALVLLFEYEALVLLLA